jgi:hypothetical protein
MARIVAVWMEKLSWNLEIAFCDLKSLILGCKLRPQVYKHNRILLFCRRYASQEKPHNR